MIQRGKFNHGHFVLIAGALALVASSAHAYVGPGAGLSLLTALWGIVAAVGVAIFFVLMWPIRRLLRARKQRSEQTMHHASGAAAANERRSDVAQASDADHDVVPGELVAARIRAQSDRADVVRDQRMR